jgi:hypothetical protein
MKTFHSTILISAFCASLFSCSTRDSERSSSYTVSEGTKNILRKNKEFPGYNHEYKTRDGILGINESWSSDADDSIRPFSGLSVHKLDDLVAGKFIDPDAAPNGAPSAREFIDFMSTHPQLSIRGYAVSPNRKDYSVVLIGMEATDSMMVTPMMKKDFQKFCESADTLYTENILYSEWK